MLYISDRDKKPEKTEWGVMLKWRSVKTQAGLPVTVEEISTVVRWTLYVPELKQTEQRGTRHFKIMSFKDISSEAFLFFSPLLLIFIVFNYNLIVATQDLSRDPNKYFPEVSSSWSFHCLYILDTRFPIRYMIAMIFSHHRGCLFTFLIMAFDMQIFLILIKSTLLFFFCFPSAHTTWWTDLTQYPVHSALRYSKNGL